MNKQQILELFQVQAKTEAPEISIYSEIISSRLHYVCKFVFNHVLNVNYNLSQNKNEFLLHTGPKINYSNEVIAGCININSHQFLFETVVNEKFIPQFEMKENRNYCFLNTDKCDLGFDIFSAVFYCISRYEEWQPFEPDSHGRFEAVNSVLHKKELLKKPLVNIWIEELKSLVSIFHPDLIWPSKKFQYISTIDVDNLFAYKHKGFLRTFMASAKDKLTLNFGNLFRRWKVILGGTNDPFDVYDELVKNAREFKIPLFFFFLQRSGTKHDRTINPISAAFGNVISKLKGEKVEIGLHPSYDSWKDGDLIKQEKSVLEANAGRKITQSRQHFLRFDHSQTPDLLLQNGIQMDYSMGYASAIGYRASTFTPFYHFDLTRNMEIPLLRVPFVVMDGAYFIYQNLDTAEMLESICEMAAEAKRLKGLFITIFHERTFDEKIAPGASSVYYKIQEELKG